jgi:hypothetical protein
VSVSVSVSVVNSGTHTNIFQLFRRKEKVKARSRALVKQCLSAYHRLLPSIKLSLSK